MSIPTYNFLFGGPQADLALGGPTADLVVTGGGDDIIVTEAGADVILAGDGNDLIDAGADDDIVLAGDGDDYIRAGAGSDFVDGGAGFDLAVVEGRFSDYQVSIGIGGVVTLATLGGSDVDFLTNVEAIYFEGDDFIYFLDGRNNAVLTGDDEVAASSGQALTIDASVLLANDVDFDGDVVSIAAVAGTSALGATVGFDGTQVVYEPGDLFASLAAGEQVIDSFTYAAGDGNGGFAEATVTVVVTGQNDAPILSAPAEVAIAENTTEVTTIAATDIDGDAITFAITGGADAALFAVDPDSGALSFIAAPDFEAPGDAGGDNIYDVTVSALDGAGGQDSADIAVTVTDEVEGPPVEARINEFHYDNDGADIGEFVEIRLTAGADPSAFSVEFYNGSNGTVYRTETLGNLAGSDAAWDYYVIDLPPNGIQNGAPDGLALIGAGAVIEFLSYEGAMTATNGTAAGLTSSDIGVSEPSSTPIGFSLQRGAGDTWDEPREETKGAGNGGAPEFRINEVHYDNEGGDVGEFVELRVSKGADVSALSVEFYNGSNGTVYRIEGPGSVAGSDDAWDYYVIDLPPNGIQNGAPDGFALINAGAVVEFLSYEGTLTASDGTAVGLTSSDIGVAETGSTPIGFSLQRGEGDAWDAARAETKGGDNGGDSGPGGDAELRLISTIQGEGAASPLAGEATQVEAIVTYLVSNGFYLQEEAEDEDGNALTSEGIFVFTGSTPTVAIGDLVRVTGLIEEFFGSTQIGGVSDVAVVSSGNPVPTGATISLSPEPIELEQLEGMRVSVQSGTQEPLTIIENFNFDRFGEIVVSAGEQFQPTQIFDPQTEAAQVQALAQANANNRLAIDDGNGAPNPDFFNYVPATIGDNGNGILDADDSFSAAGPTLRLGTEIIGSIEGVLSFSFGEYKLLVDGTLNIDETTNSGARQDAPSDVGGTLKVASFNVLNYFTTIDVSGAGSGPNNLDPRGADTPEELVRQEAKIVNAMLAMDADVFALQELENGGFGPGSAIATLVAALNTELAIRGVTDVTYDFIDPTTDAGFIGTDAITTGLIYNNQALSVTDSTFLTFEEASGDATIAAIDAAQAFVSVGNVDDLQRNRPAVIATLEDENGEAFTVVSTHFKSKGPSGLDSIQNALQAALDGGALSAEGVAVVTAALADPNFDTTGQAYWSGVRTDAVNELTAFLEGWSQDSDLLILGDFNAYAKEDPVQAATDAGYVDLIDQFIGQDEAFSFIFDGQKGTLDQAVATAGMAAQVTGVTEWHINAQEPDLLSYDLSFNNPAFYDDSVFAASDHDPLLIGLNLGIDVFQLA